MTSPSVILRDVNLHYSSMAFRERSAKALLAGLFRPRQRRVSEDVQALCDVTLSLPAGIRLGVLGCNGTGKRTLLKAIAGLYPLSSGEIEVSGRVRALLELGLGFEPDATGRENVPYRGLLLGQAPLKMRSRREEIVAFADLDAFIDMPLKTYSAGMTVRLAFAISTAIDGEVLLIDEVFGAGDANFQRKARGRILGMIERSQVLVFASHDLGLLPELCQRGIVLSRGSVVFDGKIETAIAFYREHGRA